MLERNKAEPRSTGCARILPAAVVIYIAAGFCISHYIKSDTPEQAASPAWLGIGIALGVFGSLIFCCGMQETVLLCKDYWQSPGTPSPRDLQWRKPNHVVRSTVTALRPTVDHEPFTSTLHPQSAEPAEEDDKAPQHSAPKREGSGASIVEMPNASPEGGQDGMPADAEERNDEDKPKSPKRPTRPATPNS